MRILIIEFYKDLQTFYKRTIFFFLLLIQHYQQANLKDLEKIISI